MVALSGVTQVKKETLRAYIDQFTKLAVAVGRTDKSLKCWIFERGLRPDIIFQEKLCRKDAHILKELLSWAQPYMKYKEKLLADRGG